MKNTEGYSLYATSILEDRIRPSVGRTDGGQTALFVFLAGNRDKHVTWDAEKGETNGLDFTQVSIGDPRD